MTDIHYSQCPLDTISKIAITPHDDIITSSWDASISLFDAQGELKSRVPFQAPLLDVVYAPFNKQLYTGGIDGILYELHLNDMNKSTQFGQFQNSISCLAWNESQNFIMSGSWDKSIQIFNVHQSPKRIQEISVPGKVFCMDSLGYKLIVGLSDRVVQIYDMRQLASPIEERMSPLKYMTRKIACMSSLEGFIISSIEGRIALEYFDSDKQGKKYAFKCHRLKSNTPNSQEEEECIYSVDALAHHPKNQVFASGGQDGIVNLWDGDKKKRIKQFKYDSNPISCLAFNSTGTKLAIGLKGKLILKSLI